MTTRIDAGIVTADHGLESKHRALWALGDYTTVATELVSPLGPVLVQASGIGAGDRVLDVAAGAGNAAIPAALAGANVIASDLVPELLERGGALARARGVDLQWLEANAEALPFDGDEFDAVLSCVGVMFAPHHQRAADELVRVCRPGGTIGLISWTPEGFIGQMFATMKPYVAAPPPGLQPPPKWGSAELRARSAGRWHHRLHRATPCAESGPVCRRGIVPRLFQSPLRADDLGVPGDRGRAGPDRSAGRRAG